MLLTIHSQRYRALLLLLALCLPVYSELIYEKAGVPFDPHTYEPLEPLPMRPFVLPTRDELQRMTPEQKAAWDARKPWYCIFMGK